MGEKTTANELDNARISFSNFIVPQDALLDRYAGFDMCVWRFLLGVYVTLRLGTATTAPAASPK
jgi:hypothetical protein